MRISVRTAAAIGLGALAALFVAPGAEAARKSWAEECKAKPNLGDRPEITDEERCCFDKMSKCEKSCGDIHDGGSAINQCERACITSAQKCVREVRKRAAPNRFKAVTRPTGKAYDAGSRVCCRTGRRHQWTTQQDCRKRAGQTVHGNFCRNPAVRTGPAARRLKPAPAKVCCRRGKSHQWASPSACRASRGRPVNGNHCRQGAALRTQSAVLIEAAEEGGGVPSCRARNFDDHIGVCCAHRRGGNLYYKQYSRKQCRDLKGSEVARSKCPARHRGTPGKGLVCCFTIKDEFKGWYGKATKNWVMMAETQCKARGGHAVDKKNCVEHKTARDRMMECKKLGADWVWDGRRCKRSAVRDRRGRTIPTRREQIEACKKRGAGWVWRNDRCQRAAVRDKRGR